MKMLCYSGGELQAAVLGSGSLKRISPRLHQYRFCLFILPQTRPAISAQVDVMRDIPS